MKSLIIRLKNAVRAFCGKPANHITMNLGLRRCDQCDRGDCTQCCYKDKFKELTEENDGLYRLVDDKIQENQRLTEELDKYKVINRLLEQDITDRNEMLEKKVEEVYPEFMRDYKCLREELDGAYEELAELRKEAEG